MTENQGDTPHERAQLLNITPEIASQMMLKNFRNRPINYTQLGFLEREMAEGRWVVNGETIIISEDGELMDGQHRLQACINTGVTFKSWVMYGAEESARKTLNNGRRRTGGDVLGIAGKTNGKTLACALGWIKVYELSEQDKSPPSYKRHVSPTEIVEVLARYPRLEESVVQWCNKCRGIINPSMLCALHYLASTEDHERADAFCSALTTGLDLEFDNPAYHLRERLQRNRSGNAKLTPIYIFQLLIKAWEAYRVGAKMKQLKIRQRGAKTEAWPQARQRPKTSPPDEVIAF